MDDVLRFLVGSSAYYICTNINIYVNAHDKFKFIEKIQQQ